jgi:hypothetical protein
VYQGINIKYVKAFLGQKKKKENGKTCSHVNIRKYHDAIIFGAEKAGVSLSPLHQSEMKKFLVSFKKETKQAKVMGDLVEDNADPSIPFAMKPTDRIPKATGIPPHVKELGLLKDTLHTCSETLQTLKDMIPDMKKCIKESIKEAAEHFAQSNGHVTSSCLAEMFETFENKVMKEIKLVTQTQHTAATGDRPPTQQTFGFQNLLFGTYEYNDRTDWQVPQDFTFPASTQRRAGWDLWLKGDPSHHSRIGGEWRNTPVRPYRLMDPKHLPLKVRTVFKRSWRPIFQLMEEAPQVSIPRDPSSLDAPKINELYNRGTQHLKSKFSYIWPGGDDNEEHKTRREKWSVATWSSKISRNQVVKRGSQADQSHLAAATRYNVPHSHRPRKKRQVTRPQVTRPQVTRPQVTRRGLQNRHDQEEVDQTLGGKTRGLGAAMQDRAEIEIKEVR